MLKSYVFRIFGVLILLLSVSNTQYLMSNSYYSLSHDAFDGFVMPIQNTVDWVNLPAAQHKDAFNTINSSYIIPLPNYNSKILSQSLNGVGFSSASDLNIRNSKITYSVPYLGNYKLDGIQNSGSHPGVDIKLLKNTPLFAIANGVVVKSVKSSIGFGNYIVVLHKGVIDPKNPNQKTDIYSTYAHLDRILVEEGQIISKNQLIAYSGDSGLATTAHLDFQLNTKDVPFLPYWPFNVNEVSEQGYDFVSAVNQRLGYEDALKYTINPFEYINKYKDFAWNTQVLNSEIESYRTESTLVIETQDQISKDSSIPSSNLNSVELVSVNVPNQSLYINHSTLKITLNQTIDFKDLSVNSNLFKVNFKNQDANSLYYDLEPLNFGSDNLTISYQGTLLDSKPVNVLVFKDVSLDNLDNIHLKALFDNHILKGYSDGSIDTESKISKIEAIVLISRLLESNFDNSNSWYLPQLNNAIFKKAVNPDINLTDSINKAEFLKIIYTLLDVDLPYEVHSFYSELFDVNAWYAPFVQEAYRKNILSTKDLLSLDTALTRGEVFELIYDFMQILK